MTLHREHTGSHAVGTGRVGPAFRASAKGPPDRRKKRPPTTSFTSIAGRDIEAKSRTLKIAGQEPLPPDTDWSGLTVRGAMERR